MASLRLAKDTAKAKAALEKAKIKLAERRVKVMERKLAEIKGTLGDESLPIAEREARMKQMFGIS